MSNVILTKLKNNFEINSVIKLLRVTISSFCTLFHLISTVKNEYIKIDINTKNVHKKVLLSNSMKTLIRI